MPALLHFLQFFFAPVGQPWYTGAVWSNVVGLAPCAVGGWLYHRAKMETIQIALEKLHDSHIELHAKLDALQAPEE